LGGGKEEGRFFTRIGSNMGIEDRVKCCLRKTTTMQIHITKHGCIEVVTVVIEKELRLGIGRNAFFLFLFFFFSSKFGE
jgi:hypothetical protein